MSTHQPSQHLFALLDYVGIRQVDIAEHLGVSKSLVSLWFNEKKSMPAPYYVTLLQWALTTFKARWDAGEWPGLHKEEFKTFNGLVDAAQAERDPDHFRNDIVFYARLLISLLSKSQEPWPSIHTDEGMHANLIGAQYAEQHAMDMLMKARYWRKYVEATAALVQHKPIHAHEGAAASPS